MKNPSEKKCYVTWSGGIDSTAVIGQLLEAGWKVFPVHLSFGELNYQDRECAARDLLTEMFEMRWPDQWNSTFHADGDFLSAFMRKDTNEIPRRNKHILDFMMENFVIPEECYYVGMGEYIGADTWVVKDHVGEHDADARYLASYLLREYGSGYRLMTLADFGESRYKADRVRLLVDSIGPDYAMLTTNCMGDMLMHCGHCYKCVERHVAFEEVLGFGMDNTEYAINPENASFYKTYLQQSRGELVNLSWDQVRI